MKEFWTGSTDTSDRSATRSEIDRSSRAIDALNRRG